MPWKDTCVLDRRMRFMMDYEIGNESLAALCRMYGISRPTAYKWLARYAAGGVAALADRSRARRHHPNAVAPPIEQAVVAARRRYPRWGPKKLRQRLEADHPDQDWPAPSTIGEILNRHGLTVRRKRRRRTEPYTQPFTGCNGPNTVWCGDHKGWFRTGDGSRCVPLTISDAYSRYLLRCQATTDTGYESARGLFEAAFREYGLPRAIRTDNGSPFASRGIGGLSRLSVWWIKLGIVPERIDPGHPEQNGRHERMHLTLKQETAMPPARTLRAQQRVFDRFRQEYNDQRPHEALGQTCPGSVYAASPRPYPEREPEVGYGSGLAVRIVQARGEFYWKHQRVFLGEAFCRESVGLEPVDDRYRKVYFRTVLLGVFDSYELRVLKLGEARRRLELP